MVKYKLCAMDVVSATATKDYLIPQFGATVPPCRICEEKGTGFHYGVNTCEACKTFFGRCLSNKKLLRCKRHNMCVISSGKRNCAACRYQKCISLGMSREAIRAGRCSYERKTKVIEEVKKLELQARIKQDGRTITSAERYSEMDRTIHALAATHLQSVPDTSKLFASIPQREKQYLCERALEHTYFGSRRPLDHTEFSEIYSLTGLDVDNRKSKIAQSLPVLEKSLKDFQAFAKATPGYTELPPQDQLTLIKASSLETWAFQFSYLFNTDERVCVHPYDPSLVLSLDDMISFQTTVTKDFCESLWRIVIRIQNLDLTEEESVMASALCLMLADADLTDVAHKIAWASSEYILEAFQYLVEKNHEPEEHVVRKTLQILTDLRSLGDCQKEYTKNFIEDCKGMELPKNYAEIFGEN